MWWWVVGAFLLGNANGKTNARKEAAIQQNAMLTKAENMAKVLSGLQQKQHKVWLPLITRTALRSQSNTQNYVSNNVYQLEKKLLLPQGTIYNELKNNWDRYFTSQMFGHLKINGDFDGDLV